MNVRILNINKKDEAVKYIKKIGADKSSLNLLAPKSVFKTILLEKIDNRAANLIKQEALSLGCDAAVNWQVSNFKKGSSSLLIMATEKQLGLLLKKLERQPFGLKKIGLDISSALENYEITDFTIGRLKILAGKPLVMGILNVTPDSFSDGNCYYDPQRALEHALAMESQGASIIDIGGESSRPGAKAISIHEEIKRVVPVIKQLSKKLKVLISVDTYKSEVARAAIDSGAGMINDISGLRNKNGAMAKLAAKTSMPVVIMHMQGSPGNMQKDPHYEDVAGEIKEFFTQRIEFCQNAGIKPENIIIDPGIGFGKTLAHNLTILKDLKEFSSLAKPIMVGTSLKSFIGGIMGGISAQERLPGSLATCVWAAMNGAGLLRVHNVKETIQALKVIKAIEA